MTCASGTLFIRILLLSLALLLCTTTSPAQAWERGDPLRVLVEQAAPLFFIENDDPPTGLLVDLWRLWAKDSGIQITFTGVPPGEALAKLRQGEGDLALGVVYSTETSKQLLFSPPFFKLPVSIFYRSTLVDKPNTLADLVDLRVGVLKGETVGTLNAKQQPSSQREPYHGPVKYSSSVRLIEAALKQDIDAFIIGSPLASIHLSRLDAFNSIRKAPAPVLIRNLHAAVRQGEDQLLSLVNRGIAAISGENFSAITNRWNAEIWAAATVQPPRKVIIASSSGSAPFHFIDEKGRAIGMIVDLWQLWSQRTGIEIEFSPVPWGETLKMIKEGRADIHAGLFYSEDRDRYLDYASALFKSETHFFHHKSLPNLEHLAELPPYRVGIIDGDFAISYFEKMAPRVDIGRYASNQDLFNGIEAGEIRVFVKDTPIAIYHLSQRGILDQYRYPQNRPLYSNIFYAGVQQGDSKLLSVVSNGMATITHEERAAIARKWMKNSELKSADALTVAIPRDYAPYASLNPRGEAIGLLVDLWRLWAKKVGQKVEFRAFAWEDSLKAVRRGDADIHAALFRTEKRKNWAEFSQPFYQLTSALFTPHDGKKVTRIEDLSGQRVGAIRGTYQEEYLRESYPELEVVGYRSPAALVEATRKGDIQGYLDEVAVAVATLERLGKSGEIIPSSKDLLPRNLHSAVRKDNKALLRLINKGLSSITRSELGQLEKRWLRNSNRHQAKAIYEQIRLTATEEEWLKRHRHLRLGVDPAWPPFEWLEKDGRYRGIASDYVKLLTKQLDLTFEVLPDLSWAEVMNRAENHKLDVLPCVAQTPERKKFLNFSEPYLKFPWVIITRTNTPFVSGIKALLDKQVAVVQGYAIHERLRSEHPELTLHLVKTPLEGLRAVSLGQVEAYVGNLAVTSYLIQQQTLANLKVASPVEGEKNEQLRFAVRSDWPELVSILNKALAAITPRERTEIESKWLTVRYEHKTEWGYVLRVGGTIAAIIGLILIIIVVWNRRLAADVERRRILEAALIEARKVSESANRTKSAFLASMSHELRTPLNSIIGFSTIILDELAGPLNLEQKKQLKMVKGSSRHLLNLINDVLDISKIEAGELKLSWSTFNMREVIEEVKETLAPFCEKKNIPMIVEIAPEVGKIYSDERRIRQVLINLANNAIKFTETGEVRVDCHVTGDRIETRITDTGIGIKEEDIGKLFQPFQQVDTGTARQYEGTGLGLSVCKRIIDMVGGEIAVESRFGEGSTFWFYLPLKQEG